MQIHLTLHFPKGYVAHPYWPAREKLISIQKTSGVNRARSLDKRAKVLKAYLDSVGMTLADYQALEADAARPFYTVRRQDGTDEIVVPAHQLHGFLAQAAALAPGMLRFVRPEQIRSVVEFSDLATGKTKPDGVWERFVPVKSGTGQMLSNQRGLRSDPYIADVRASGLLCLAVADLEPKLRQFLAWGGQEIGVGAARKMSWGRFVILEWSP